MSAPSGTVTFLFTDIEGSTRLWQADEMAMRAALSRHDELLRKTVDDHDGVVFSSMGDGIAAAFSSASSAVAAALDAQGLLGAEPWPTATPVKVRMGLHTGEAELRDGDYFGTAVNRGARLMAIGHGGQVLCSSATAELVGDAGLVLVDLGERLLRDLDRPMRVFQVGGDGLSQEFPPLRSVDAFPGNLPVELSSFVGRDAELLAVEKALGLSRLVTVTGVGGVGKTRLAVQVGAELLSRFPDGVWLCELAAGDDSESMHQVVAATLGVAARPGLDLPASVAEFLAAKNLLVVFDNCEHVLDAAAALVAVLLGGCPGVRVLATSREALALDGERTVPVRSLSLPEASSDLEQVATSDAVRLFVERAETVRASFTLTAANAGAVGEVCRRLDGIPLALELAAARVATMGPAEIAGHLDERFRLLAGRRRGSLERHQTLRATLDWSYSLLTPDERAIFDRLGVFAASFDSDAAVAVAATEGVEAWDVLDGLASLAAKSMLVVDATDDDGSTRYRLLETLRHYARERLAEDDDPDRWRARHAEHYARLAATIGEALTGPGELAWRRRFTADLDDLRAALNWSLDTDGSDHAVRIVAALSVQAADQEPAGIGEWAERCVSRAQSASPPLRTAVLGAAAYHLSNRLDMEGAVVMGRDALRDGLPEGCPALGVPHMALAGALMFLGRHIEAEIVIADGHAALDRIGAPKYAHTHLVAVEIFSFPGRPEGREAADAALASARQAGSPTSLAVALFAVAYSNQNDDPVRALAAAEENLAVIRAGAGDGSFWVTATIAAVLYARRGSSAAALGALRAAVSWGIDNASRGALSNAAIAGVEVMADLDRPETAAVLAGICERTLGQPGALIPSLALHYDAKVAEARRDLGGEAFDTAFATGATMTDDSAVRHLLDEIERLQTGLTGPE